MTKGKSFRRNIIFLITIENTLITLSNENHLTPMTNMHPNDGRVVSNFIVQALSQKRELLW